MKPPHDPPTPRPPRRPTKGLSEQFVPRFTPPPERLLAVPQSERPLPPSERPLVVPLVTPGPDATISELPPASHLSWAEPPQAKGPVFQLVRVVDGFPLARHVFAQGLVRIGRGEDCDLRLDDKSASRYHALIERHADDYLLHDQMSSNGVQVNGARVERSCRLRDGDVLLLGSTRLVFQTALGLEAPLTAARPAPASPSLTPSARARPTVRAPAPPAASGPVPVVIERAAVLPRAPASGPAPASVVAATPAVAPGPDVTLAPPSDSSPDLEAPRPKSEADEIMFGRTLGVAPARLESDQREAGIAVRAYLRATEEKRWSASHLGRAGAQHVLARDAFVIGAGEGVDLRVEARLMPRVVAVIVRGLTGFSLSQVAGWPWTTRVNGRVVADLESLEDGDVLLVAGRTFTFHLGSPMS